MAETLGSLCDKLTIVKLKRWHSKKREQLIALSRQEKQLTEEIDGFLKAALSSDIPLKHLRSSANKVFKNKEIGIFRLEKDIGGLFSKLAEVNCELWHIQEKVYDFENVPASGKNAVVKRLAVLNLNRNACVEKIDSELYYFVKARKK